MRCGELCGSVQPTTSVRSQERDRTHGPGHKESYDKPPRTGHPRSPSAALEPIGPFGDGHKRQTCGQSHSRLCFRECHHEIDEGS